MKRVEHLIISGQANEYLKMDSLNSRKTTISVRSITWCDEIWYNFEMRSGIVSCLKLLWFSPMRSSSKVIQPKWSVEVLYHLPSSIHPSTHSPPWISNYKKCSFFVIWNVISFSRPTHLKKVLGLILNSCGSTWSFL